MVAKGPDLLAAHVRRLRSAPLAGLSDGELLRRFIEAAPDAGPAFEVLVRRHGPMVLSACRAALGGDTHAADDTFQAVFLVLVRKARSFRPSEPLGPWLFGIARRVCSQARAAKARRARHETLAARTRGEIATTEGGPTTDVAAVVHAEVGRLPTALCAAVVLCDLAGLSYEEAAGRLGVSHPTLRGRLARARERLRRRLELRGLRPDGVWAAAVVVPSPLVSVTADAAAVMTGRAAGLVSKTVLELVNGGLHSMVFTKFKAAGLSALTAGVLVAGAVGLSAQAPGPRPTTIAAPATEADPLPRVRTVLGLATASEDADPGDDVANLVRRAQRQQDRGDAAGARRTVSQVQAALKRWTAQLDEPTPRTEERRAPTSTPAPPGRGFGGGRAAPAGTPPPIGPAGGVRGGITGDEAAAPEELPPAGGRGRRAPAQASPAAIPSAVAPATVHHGVPLSERSSDLEKRLRDLEGKLDRVLRELEKR